MPKTASFVVKQIVREYNYAILRPHKPRFRQKGGKFVKISLKQARRFRIGDTVRYRLTETNEGEFMRRVSRPKR